MATKSKEQEELDRQRWIAKGEALSAIIMPVAQRERDFDYRWQDVERYMLKTAEDFGPLEMDPDFQRGHVWTQEQQLSFVQNALRGTVSTSGFILQFNCPNWNDEQYDGELPLGLQCLDGLQRYTAVQAFIKGEIKPFGLTVEDLSMSRFAVHHLYFKIAMYTYGDRVSLLDHYLAFNDGGVAHSQEELQRVRALRDEAMAKFRQNQGK